MYKKVRTIQGLVTALIIAGIMLLQGATTYAAPPAPASGTFSVTEKTSLSIQPAGGGNFIIEQTTAGVFTGTFSGTFVDELRAVLHSNGNVGAQGTITCTCTVEGKSGTIVFNQTSRGPAGSAFQGRAVILSGTGDLANMRGTLEIQGTGSNGIATVAYSGQIHFDP